MFTLSTKPDLNMWHWISKDRATLGDGNAFHYYGERPRTIKMF